MAENSTAQEEAPTEPDGGTATDASASSDEALSQETQPPTEPCPEGRQRTSLTAGRCCWPEQHWDTAEERCAGMPECPQGFLVGDDDCAPGELPLWVTVRAGTFDMGSPETEEHRFDDERQVRVSLSRGFRIRTTETTQGEFQKIMGYNPARFVECGESCPVERTSWHEAAAFTNALSEQAGLEPCYTCSGSPPDIECRPSAAYAAPSRCPGVRLPTEAEWEYAIRAGSPAPRYGELSRIAWFRGTSGGRTHRVATREPNAWGIHDMFGNVMEWCHDWYAPYSQTPQSDPSGPSTGTIRVLRGGSWLINDWRVRAAYRYRFDPRIHVSYVGFRVVQTLR